jgi:hypothetical protein
MKRDQFKRGLIVNRNKQFSILVAALASFWMLLPAFAQAGNVGWNVSVGGGWNPAAYGPVWGSGWGPGWGPGWRGNWAYGGGYYGPYTGYYAPPVVTYVQPVQPMVLASQPQPAVWYYCEASGKYFPYVQECPTGWQTQPAMPPASNTKPKQQH